MHIIFLYSFLCIGALSQVSQPRPPHRMIRDPAGNSFPVVIHDWNTMPNIVHNILNAHLGYNAAGTQIAPLPGLIYVATYDSRFHVVQEHVLTANFGNGLTKVAPATGVINRKYACGDGYGMNLYINGRYTLRPDQTNRYQTRIPPAVGTLYNYNIMGDGGVVPQRDFNTPTNNVYAGILLPSAFSCDEYPFASTTQGSSNARLSLVPDIEQDEQKDVISSAGRTCRLGHIPWAQQPFADYVDYGGISPGDGYYVGVVNVPTKVYNMFSGGQPIAPGNPPIPDYCTVWPRPERKIITGYDEVRYFQVPTSLSCMVY